MATDPETLANSKRAYLVAPAGCGKTHIIAEAMRFHNDGRQLILTHTHAGLRALRDRLREFNVPSSRYRLETISGFALKYVSAYPKLAGSSERIKPKTSEEWQRVYMNAERLFRNDAVKEVIMTTYKGMYVDEYQDCILEQHRLILALADLLPCRILEDPLQGIFGFGGQQTVDLNRDIKPHFEELPSLDVPYRWKNRNEELGFWLTGVRKSLEEGRPIDLNNLPKGVKWVPVSPKAQRCECFRLCGEKGSVAAIHEGTLEHPCNNLAQKLGGRYQSMEPIDSKFLFVWAKKIEHSSGSQRACRMIEFCKKCMNRIDDAIGNIYSKFQRNATVKGYRIKKNKHILEILLEISENNSLGPIYRALVAIRELPGIKVYRREAFEAMLSALTEFQKGNHTSLADAAWEVRNRTRYVGRKVDYRCVTRTLLIKGLEFDHAVVLNADKLDMKQLYVAMTRGSYSLTILSINPILSPCKQES